MPEVRSRLLSPLLGALALVAVGLTGCSGSDGNARPATTTAARADAPPPDANTVSIGMKDYEYSVSGGLVAGRSTVVLHNTGSELHMAAFGLLKEGKTLADARAAYQSEDERAPESVFASPVGQAPGALLSPGQSQELTTDLLVAGTYAVLCFLPTAGGPGTHLARGMAAAVVVTPGTAGHPPRPSDADYVVGDGTVDGPATLAAGTRTLRVTAAGTGPHEFFVVRRRDPGATYADVDAYFARLLEGDTPPPVGYADAAPGIFAAGSFDLASGRTVLLTTRLEPGTYLVGCALENDPAGAGAGAGHTGEILEVTVTEAPARTGSR